jgi:hypothetical protein
MSAEAKLQSKAINYARDAGLLTKRNYMAPGAETGWPDVEYFAFGGRMFFIEFKAPDGSLRARQEYIIALLRERGFTVHVCDCYEDARRIIDAHRAAGS